MYRNILLAYDGSETGRRALREGAALALGCHAEVFLLAVVETIQSPERAEIDLGPYKEVLAEGVRRLQALGFRPKSRLGWGEAGLRIVDVAREIVADLVVAGHRHKGPLAEWWSSSVGTYLVKHLNCSVLIGQSDITDEDFEKITRAARAQFARLAAQKWGEPRLDAAEFAINRFLKAQQSVSQKLVEVRQALADDPGNEDHRKKSDALAERYVALSKEVEDLGGRLLAQHLGSPR